MTMVVDVGRGKLGKVKHAFSQSPPLKRISLILLFLSLSVKVYQVSVIIWSSHMNDEEMSLESLAASIPVSIGRERIPPSVLLDTLTERQQQRQGRTNVLFVNGYRQQQQEDHEGKRRKG